MRSVQALAVAVLSLLSACQVASAAEPKQGGISQDVSPRQPGQRLDP